MEIPTMGSFALPDGEDICLLSFLKRSERYERWERYYRYERWERYYRLERWERYYRYARW
jgi:hypothetical protein